jgi:Type IV secretory system Conjugative DNA transfer
MRHEPARYHEPDHVPDTFLLVAVVAVLAVTVLLWLVGQVAAVLFGAHHWLHLSLADTAAVPFRVIHHPGDPRLAWPPEARGQLPGPVGMYTALALVLLIPSFLVGVAGVRWFGWDRRVRQHGAKWASRWNLRRLLVLTPRPGRITLGRRGGWFGRLLLAVESCHSVLAFGPGGSHKTTGLVIPGVLEWQGPVVTTSIKPDVLRATLRRRLAMGEVWVYDPLGLSGVPGAQWTPLAHCHTYTAARKVARTLADAADVQGLREQDNNYWTLLGAKLLGVLLFAAARSDRTMADVARWVDIQEQACYCAAACDLNHAALPHPPGRCNANTDAPTLGQADRRLLEKLDPERLPWVRHATPLVLSAGEVYRLAAPIGSAMRSRAIDEDHQGVPEADRYSTRLEAIEQRLIRTKLGADRASIRLDVPARFGCADANRLRGVMHEAAARLEDYARRRDAADPPYLLGSGHFTTTAAELRGWSQATLARQHQRAGCARSEPAIAATLELDERDRLHLREAASRRQERDATRRGQGVGRER